MNAFGRSRGFGGDVQRVLRIGAAAGEHHRRIGPDTPCAGAANLDLPRRRRVLLGTKGAHRTQGLGRPCAAFEEARELVDQAVTERRPGRPAAAGNTGVGAAQPDRFAVVRDQGCGGAVGEGQWLVVGNDLTRRQRRIRR